MKSAAAILLAATGASAFAPQQTSRASVSLAANTQGDLETLAKDLNPIVGFFDPLGLADGDFYGMGNAASIGFLRQAEIKHGRIAMFAFVGYCVQSNWIFPWPQHLDGSTGPSPDFSPEQQWDMIPEAAKWQIFGIIALLEVFDEAGGAGDGSGDHYTGTRQPGKYPAAQPFRDNVHFVLDLYDGPSPDFSPEQQWDMIPEAAKWQIFGIIALLEVFDEAGGAGDGSGDHYTGTRQPGKYPTAQPFRDNVHFVLDLYDPFGFSKNKSEESKARGLKAEINNGRLAMLGIFGFITADKVPGSVPLLEKLGAVIPYSGETMAPFEANFHVFN
eukprot:CAMPEP_0194095266 /NCGR_PEP_ID=MMETSP0149-20130528/56739_1 /TAXON_ID=122233 /ORGANISM="Chaetoceros debilis, Strain MM31A-1" /LENGTH=329 /DNA_ID=CAMNT_0038781207 /DNA_START=63 /DNA_END=1052 /DNA_ORIENTATION=+